MTVFGFGVPKGIILLFFCTSAVSGCSALSFEEPFASLRAPAASSDAVTAPSALRSSDKSLADKSLQSALENAVSGKSVTWKNPASGAQGSITPLKTWKNDQGAYCRSYSEWIRPATGKSIRRNGVACRSQNAVWKTA
nr:RT0821/Lpp0805 family surface protein [Roseibium sp. CAU 1639]